MVLHWSTQSVPAAQRFEQWREACCEHIYALTPRQRGRGPFNGAIARRQWGALDVSDIRCDGHTVQRSAQDISECPSDTYYVYQQRRGGAWFEQRGQRCVAEAGDIVIADPDVAFTTSTDQSFDFRLWRIARPHLQPLLRSGRPGELAMVRIDRSQPERALIGGWLDALLQHHAELPLPTVDVALQTLCALVAQSMGAAFDAREPAQRARRRALLQRVVQHVQAHAQEPDLTPERVSTSFAISLRTLHQLFELADCSFHETLTRARLARAHAMLRDPAASHLGTADIGFATGFGDVSTFYRRFKQRYGLAPGEFRGR